MRSLKFTLIILISLLIVIPIRAKEQNDSLIQKKVDYQFLYSQYNNFFSEVPSLLSLWNYDNWSYLGMKYNFQEGNFRDLQKYNKLQQLNISTESLYKLPNTNWTFHGKFSYSNGQADSVGSNLSYNIGRNGSPYYLLQLKRGNWSLQSYQFYAAGSNEISERLSLGFKIGYIGDLAFRTLDTRNSQPTLHTNIVLSANYKVTEKQTISMGLEHDRLKTEPSLSDKFQHTSADQRYGRYLNGGLGTYFKNVNYRLINTTQKGGILLQWLCQNKYSTYTAIYKTNLGQDIFVNKNITDVNEEHRVLNYSFNQHYGRLSTLNKVSNYFIISKLDFTITKGNGKIWNEPDNSYIENYKADIFQTDFKATLYSPLSSLRRINLLVNYINESRFDGSYGYSFDYSTLFGELNTEFLFNFSSIRTGLMIGAAYGKNLNNYHNPNAASSNLYLNWVADPLMSFLATDYIEIPAYLRFDIPVKNSLIELLLTAKHQFPLKMNYQTGAQFDLKDKFLSYCLSVRVYF
ncbi:MAG: DUF6850 family outer membrane beta-barrel protein [Bacteroidales bacterium]